MHQRYIRLAAVLTASLLILVFSGAALAASPRSIVARAMHAAPVAHPHIEFVAPIVNADGTLSVTFQEAGLGHVVTPIPSTVSATATATYDCLDVAGAIVTTETVTGMPTATVVGAASGQNTLMALLAPPGAGLAFVCPAGTTLTLAAVSYTDVTVLDTLHGDMLISAGPFVLDLLA